MFLVNSARLVLVGALLASSAACLTFPTVQEGPDDTAPPGLPPTPPGEEPPPTPAVYKRGSLTPLYELTPRAEYGRMAHKGVPMTDADFTSPAVTTSHASKMDEIAAQLGLERGTAVTVITKAEDRQRAEGMPFRGNPSDVKKVTVDGKTSVLVPLGGNLTAPGNEVAIVRADGTPALTTRVRVGVRPQRLAVHPAGLVFVCNQYSNYISIIDPRTDALLLQGAKPVEVPTEYFCGDLTFVPVSPTAPDVDEQLLLVVNRFRSSLLVYKVELERDPLNDRPSNVVSTLLGEVTGVGKNPYRITLDEQKTSAFVVSNRGGEVARVDIAGRKVTRRINAGAPLGDVVTIADSVLMTTLMQDRGLLSRDEPVKPPQVHAAPVMMKGLDGQPHEAHPGALYDGTRSYNFEDLRNGLYQFDLNLAQFIYYTDDVSSEPNFVAQQKVLAGALPQGMARNAAGTRIWVAMGGDDVVQELAVNTGVRPFSVTKVQGGLYQTRQRPFAVTIDEAAKRLYVAAWGGETLEVFDLGTRQKLAEIDLGYAQPRYPATSVERGEFYYYNTEWSNNGRKSCATCHYDELVTDGFGYSNGATAPTLYHMVKPNHNLMTTDPYFWNGSFRDGDYTSVAFAAQIRVNCENVLFGLIEGPGSNPSTRVGDPNNIFTNGQDAACRPQPTDPATKLPANFAAIQQIVAAQKAQREGQIQQITGRTRDEVSRFIDFYSVSVLRLPPNPLKHLAARNELDSATAAKLQKGQTLFSSAGCVACHNPNNQRAPFTDGLDHGPGGTWVKNFVAQYQNDPRIKNLIGSFPQLFLDGLTNSPADDAINVHVDPLSYLIPFCFDSTNCLAFEDPMAVQPGSVEETRRLELLVGVNLADPEREFIPGALRGSPHMNTVSLRGFWTQAGILHHGYARGVSEAILAPGHPALKAGERGWAITNTGKVDVHGHTSDLKADDIEALNLYVMSIE